MRFLAQLRHAYKLTNITYPYKNSLALGFRENKRTHDRYFTSQATEVDGDERFQEAFAIMSLLRDNSRLVEELLSENINCPKTKNGKQYLKNLTYIQDEISSGVTNKTQGNETPYSENNLDLDMEMTNLKKTLFNPKSLKHAIVSSEADFSLPYNSITMPLHLSTLINPTNLKVPEFNEYLTSLASNLCSASLENGFSNGSSFKKYYCTQNTADTSSIQKMSLSGKNKNTFKKGAASSNEIVKDLLKNYDEFQNGVKTFATSSTVKGNSGKTNKRGNSPVTKGYSNSLGLLDPQLYKKSLKEAEMKRKELAKASASCKEKLTQRSCQPKKKTTQIPSLKHDSKKEEPKFNSCGNLDSKCDSQKSQSKALVSNTKCKENTKNTEQKDPCEALPKMTSKRESMSKRSSTLKSNCDIKTVKGGTEENSPKKKTQAKNCSKSEIELKTEKNEKLAETNKNKGTKCQKSLKCSSTSESKVEDSRKIPTTKKLKSCGSPSGTDDPCKVPSITFKGISEKPTEASKCSSSPPIKPKCEASKDEKPSPCASSTSALKCPPKFENDSCKMQREPTTPKCNTQNSCVSKQNKPTDEDNSDKPCKRVGMSAKKTCDSEPKDPCKMPSDTKEKPKCGQGPKSDTRPKCKKDSKCGSNKPKEKPESKCGSNKPKENPDSKCGSKKPKEKPESKCGKPSPREAQEQQKSKCGSKKPKEQPESKCGSEKPKEKPESKCGKPSPREPQEQHESKCGSKKPKEQPESKCGSEKPKEKPESKCGKPSPREPQEQHESKCGSKKPKEQPESKCGTKLDPKPSKCGSKACEASSKTSSAETNSKSTCTSKLKKTAPSSKPQKRKLHSLSNFSVANLIFSRNHSNQCPKKPEGGYQLESQQSDASRREICKNFSSRDTKSRKKRTSTVKDCYPDETMEFCPDTACYKIYAEKSRTLDQKSSKRKRRANKIETYKALCTNGASFGHQKHHLSSNAIKNEEALIQKPHSVCTQKLILPEVYDNEALICVDSVALSDTDIYMFETGGKHTPGLTLGNEATGIVSEVGRSICNLKPGDHVVLESGIPCFECDLCKLGRYNLCSNINFQGFLKNQCIHPASFCHKICPRIPLEHAALIPQLALGCNASYQAFIKPKSNVAIIGSCAKTVCTAMCAISMGAENVCVVCGMPQSQILIEQFVTKKVACYDHTTSEKGIVRAILASLGTFPDIVINCSASTKTMNASIMALKSAGVCIIAGFVSECVSYNIMDAFMKEIRIIPSFRSKNMFPSAIHLLESGRAPLDCLIANRDICKWNELEGAFKLALSEGNNGPRKSLVKCQLNE
ncbi:uncharacterized protein LOC129942768 isoform X2 [Eupeodes corollae]|uniref:uncharacterized protein LOC129942768 isoform X2 n=1 Tax=Eupeodes corollae TaxID=290404 RepID=UPI002492CABB|nr:uncharacterized protein LOC129942768 isoform X2 [Eupeodes corollae]